MRNFPAATQSKAVESAVFSGNCGLRPKKDALSTAHTTDKQRQLLRPLRLRGP